ncbi:M23 family metallopeptidase [Oceanitalea stevensii]|uniref:M23 family metallopeptidase n=1 Tax=Oceanitalea stevensii TaxID=2763072 RepID=A0ABR8YXH7_9MICO|nr:M23 family metallopeptidase [Oceanitalea stevensii]MBD8060776.1 M23 family metallopeptidase [Oceanitalea stevensii]
MGLSGGAVAAAGVLAVLGGALLLAPQPAAAPPVVATRTAEAVGRVLYEWPTGDPGEVVRPFSAPPERWSAGHRGVDLALPVGADVRAAGDGVVAFAGRVAGRGVVSVDHADGLRTTYEPVAAATRRGAQVAAGQVVGVLEPLGHHCPDEPCLHWGARRGRDDYVDPLTLLTEDVVIRLLPQHG